ncbi:MAG: Ger(x)C family spore germination protein [Clostridia bacterium]|nr:Ger(x)C family spore germination protein [Clostridia bacterium]
MKKMFLIFALVVIIVSTAGCWSSTEVKNLAIVSSVIYDMDDENNYLIKLNIVNPSAIGSADTGGGGNKKAGITLDGKGKSYTEALNDVSANVDRRLFADHNKVRFLTEKVATKDYAVINFLDFIMRDALTDESALFVVIRDEDKDKLYNSTATGLSNLIGTFLDELATTQQKYCSSMTHITTLDFIKANYADGKEAVAGTLFLEETDNIPSQNSGLEDQEIQYKIVYEGLALFKDYSLVGYMNGKETEIYNILTKQAKTGIVTIPKDEDFAALTWNKPKAIIKASYNGENAIFDIKIEGELTIDKMYIYNTSEEPFSDIMKTLKKEVSEQMKTRTSAAITKAQDYGSDIFGFGAMLHAQNPKAWRIIASDWEVYFKNATFNVECDFKINQQGEINKPFIK